MPLRHLPFFLLACICLSFLHGTTIEEKLHQAQVSYKQGQAAASYQEQKEAFNRTLSLLEEVRQASPYLPNLNEALGDAYLQLNEYAWAVVYYQRALHEGSGNPTLQAHLKKAQEKLGISPSPKGAVNGEGFYSKLSQNLSLLFIALLLAFCFASCAVWFPLPWIRRGAALFVAFFLLLAGNALFFYYTSPVEGVLIQAAGFYRAADWNQPQLKANPLPAGSTVRILQLTGDGRWLKIDEDGVIGFIPAKAARLI